MNRDSFIFYRSFFEAMAGLGYEDKGKCLDALAAYAINGVEPEEMDPVVRLFFVMAKPQIDANNERFENGCKGAEYGRLGGAPKGNKNAAKNNQNNPKTTPKQPQINPKTTPNDNDNVNVNDNVLKKEKIYKKEKKATFADEFQTWWQEYPRKVSKVDAEKVFNRLLAEKKVTFDDLLGGLRRYADYCKQQNTEEQFIKHPSTWLNQGCWADEYHTQQQNNGPDFSWL